MTQPNPAPTNPTPAAGDPLAPPNQPVTPPANPPAGDDPLRPEGIRALQAERETVANLQKQLAPLMKLAEALGVDPTATKRSDLERLADEHKGLAAQLAEERQARWRAEVAAEKQMTPEQAAHLAGATREEFATSADRLLAAFPKAAAPAAPGQRPGPRPDPAQGAQPGAKPTGRDAGLAEAQKRFGKPATAT